MGLTKFQQAALGLDRGEPSATVVDLLGLPDTTEAATYGTATAKPWPGQTWTYSFARDQFNRKRCQLVFQQNTDGSLALNSWHWYDY